MESFTTPRGTPVDGTRPMRSIGFALAVLVVAACGGDGNTHPSEVDAFVPSIACGSHPLGCAANELCDYARNSCGAGGEVGACKPRPASCPILFVPVLSCGCDGRVFSSECDVAASGTDLNAAGSCPVTGSIFACGYRQCDARHEYCQRSVSDVGGEPDAYDCKALPACPGGATCGCVASQPCGDLCSGLGETGLTLTCPGG
jgi:hypothetical protein